MKVKQVMEMGIEGGIERGRTWIRLEDTLEKMGQQRRKTKSEMKRICTDKKMMKRTER